MMIRKQAVMASALLMTGCFGATAPSGTDGDAGKHTDATSPTNDRTDASTRMSDARPDAGGGKPDAELDASTGKPDADASKARPDADSGEDAAGQHTVTDVSVGFASACALASGGAVKCWGENYGGALGNGSIAGPETCSDFACSPSPLPVTGLTIATSVSVGLSAGCALLSGGTVDCWGDNASGQLGRGSATGPDDCGGFACGTTPAPVAGLAGVTAVSVGAQFACALVSGGTVECWGQNPDGELGIGNATGPEECGESACSTVPVAVPGLTGVIDISVGAVSACALLSDGTVDCWGSNVFGQLGNGTSSGPETCQPGQACSTMPVPVTGLSGVTGVAVGWYSACAILSGGTVECWGDNGDGQLGIGTTSGPETCVALQACSTTPIPLVGLSGVTSVSVGMESACALLSGGTVDCWGGNDFGELGNGGSGNSPWPGPIVGLAGVTSVSVGLHYVACATLAGGNVKCWGDNEYGELGDGTITGPDSCGGVSCSTTPVAVLW